VWLASAAKHSNGIAGFDFAFDLGSKSSFVDIHSIWSL